MAKRFGDRRDAVRVRDIDAFHAFLVHLMPNRTDAEVYMHAELDVTRLMEFIAERNLDPQSKKTTLFHAVVAAVAKVVHVRPKLNRYISGRRFYQRNGISLSFVAKKQFTDHAEEALMILHPKGDYTLRSYTDKIVGEVREAREAGDEYGADGALNLLSKLPVTIVRLFMFLLRQLDNHGLVPAPLYDIDTNQTTVLLSNLGSIKCDAVYHHLNNYGSNSIVITLGEVKREYSMDAAGEVTYKDIMPIGLTIDERIADGFYFAKSVKIISHLLANPQLLDRPLDEEFEYEH